MTPIHTLRWLVAATLLQSSAAMAMTDAELADAVGRRLHGDRTGACFAVAVVEQTVSRAIVCADPAHPRPIDAHTAFEIGSVSKTMAAALLAREVQAGRMSLDDPLSKYLPAGTRVPEFEGQPITLRHLVTHTSGLPALPPGFRPADPRDPYAKVTRSMLLDALSRVRLAQAPGTRWAYSNYAMMLLSMVLAERSGTDLETLLQRELFAPLQMDDAFIARPPQATTLADGHLPNGTATPHWTLPDAFAGVGGVRASLEDMVHYLQAQLGLRASPLPLAMTQQPQAEAGGRRSAMNWMIAPLNGADTLAHEGGTGGFSSFVAFDPARKRGVVILSDTAMTSVGGLGSLGLHLLDERVPLGGPRREVAADPTLLDALAGEYELANGMRMTLVHAEDGLRAQVAGQGEFALGHDSQGDFYPRQFDAVLRPQRRPDGGYDFTWLQGGGAVPAKRVAADAAKAAEAKPAAPAAEAPDAAALKAYEGEFRLGPGFAITVSVRDGGLFAQGTGQRGGPIQYAAPDVFVAESAGAEMQFQRDANGRVEAMLLKQRGMVQRAVKQ